MRELIDRSALIAEYDRVHIGPPGGARKLMEDAPTIEERKKGHWERHNTYYGDDVSGSIDPDWRCSECGGQANVNVWCLYDLTDFCPHCGADMREGEGEKDGQDT